MANLGGRPLKFQSVEELQKKIDEYFGTTSEERQTITGLALYLDTSRETLMNYEEKDGYFDTIKRAKDRIQETYEHSLKKRGNAGDIFALKNFGWTDKQEIVQTNVINQADKNDIIKEVAAEIAKLTE